MQAGREIRVIVEEHLINDDRLGILSQEIVRKIEKEMTFPGQIKVNVIREVRSIDSMRDNLASGGQDQSPHPQVQVIQVQSQLLAAQAAPASGQQC